MKTRTLLDALQSAPRAPLSHESYARIQNTLEQVPYAVDFRNAVSLHKLQLIFICSLTAILAACAVYWIYTSPAPLPSIVSMPDSEGPGIQTTVPAQGSNDPPGKITIPQQAAEKEWVMKGLITDEHGQSIAGAEVWLESLSYVEVGLAVLDPSQNAMISGSYSRADAEGRFTIPSCLTNGNEVIKVVADGEVICVSLPLKALHDTVALKKGTRNVWLETTGLTPFVLSNLTVCVIEAENIHTTDLHRVSFVEKEWSAELIDGTYDVCVTSVGEELFNTNLIVGLPLTVVRISVPNPELSILYGRVIDAVTRLPLEGVNVQTETTTKFLRDRTMSDVNGLFKIICNPGKYKTVDSSVYNISSPDPVLFISDQVKFVFEGYKPFEAHINPKMVESSTNEFELVPNNPGTLNVYLSSYTGEPLTNVTVYISEMNGIKNHWQMIRRTIRGYGPTDEQGYLQVQLPGEAHYAIISNSAKYDMPPWYIDTSVAYVPAAGEAELTIKARPSVVCALRILTDTGESIDSYSLSKNESGDLGSSMSSQNVVSNRERASIPHHVLDSLNISETDLENYYIWRPIEFRGTNCTLSLQVVSDYGSAKTNMISLTRGKINYIELTVPRGHHNLSGYLYTPDGRPAQAEIACTGGNKRLTVRTDDKGWFSFSGINVPDGTPLKITSYIMGQYTLKTNLFSGTRNVNLYMQKQP